MELLYKQLLDNSVKNISIVLTIILFVTIFRKTLSKYVASILYLVIKKNWPNIKKNQFVGMFLNPLSWFINVFVVVIALEELKYPGLWKVTLHEIPLQNMLYNLGDCIIIVYLIWLGRSFADFIALILDYENIFDKEKRNNQLVTFVRDFLKTIFFIVGFLLLIKKGFGININSILIELSILSAALALAAKESIENLIASFVIFFDKPFFTGDFVRVNAVTGIIEHIGLRSTRIRTIERTLVTVPNKQMVDSVVDNLSKMTERRTEIKLDFHHATTIVQIESFIAKMNLFLEENKSFLLRYSVYFIDYNKNGATVTIEYFTQPMGRNELMELRQRINLGTKKHIEALEIKIANALGDLNVFPK